MAENIVYEVRPENMKNRDYSVLVYAYALGQYRIKLTSVAAPDRYAPEGHGSIVREMCTYSMLRMEAVVACIRHAVDPELECEIFAEPWNCEQKGGRIRLDNHPEDRPETAR